MSSHRFLFVRDHEKFFNWSASIIALNLTKEALYEYMEEIADRYVRGLATDEKNHIVDFIEHNRRYFPNRDGKALMMEKLKCSCIPCASLYKRIQDDLLGSPESSVLLETPENVGRSKLWWILLKMNSRHAGKDTQQIEDCDLKLLCRIVQRCRLFAPVKNIEKISGMKFHNSRFHSTYEDCDELKQSMKWQIEAIEKDMEEFNRKHLNVIKLEEIMRIIKKNKDTVTVEQRKIIEGRKVATLDEAVEIGKQDGEQALKAGGFVGECVGGLAGGAGAWVAGNVRKQ
ncbi:uncharacterized protein LOC128554057 isoform X3 [Mercenaria mercenaria]|uniref:uncharacterized protein LOC128554057 isoform X3 n=1 Tax=Mercenaria mercenaria TaxID=6596 RepID=UPI00234F5C35|nr:uncharacterized protein LOC128554057 isoform X3 [Mercenaria mercenaria]